MRRRVASVSHIEAGSKGAGSDSAVVTHSSTPADEDYLQGNMRTDLFNSCAQTWPQSESTILIDVEDYTAMANELADIKTQLVTLQNLLVCCSSKASEYMCY